MQQSVETHQKTYHSKEIRYIQFLFFLEMIASCTTHMNLLQKKYEQFTILITMHLRNALMAKLLTLWPLPILFSCPICNFRASKQKFQICCGNMSLARFLAQFVVFCMFWEFHRGYLKFMAPWPHENIWNPESVTFFKSNN